MAESLFSHWLFLSPPLEPGGQQLADGRLESPIIPIQPYWLVSCREDGRKLWACQDSKFWFSLGWLIHSQSPYYQKLPFGYNYKDPLYNLVYFPCDIFLLILTSVFLLAMLLLLLLGVISHWTRPKGESHAWAKGEIFWVSASVPANDKDYFGDLPVPVCWMILRHPFISQHKWKNEMSNSKIFIFTLLQWPLKKIKYI